MTNGVHRAALLGLVGFAAGCIEAPDPGGSDTVQAASGPATVTTDMTAYTYATPVKVTFSGLDGAATDWIAIAPQGSPLTTTTRWSFTGGRTSGSLTFEGPATRGTYVARAFDGSSVLLGESAPFTTADPSDTMATVRATRSAYSMTDPITISWTGLPGNAHDWIAIAPQGFPLDDQAEWQYTGGGVDGSVTFPDGFQLTGFPPGNYVARAYLNDTFTLVAESPVFAIGDVARFVRTDATAYTAIDPITVTWGGLPGNATDWIGLAPSGSDAMTVATWAYVGTGADGRGNPNGSTAFSAASLPAGTYVARAFVDDSYMIIAESPPFTVSAATPAKIATDLSTYAVAQTIVVSWSGLSGNVKNWVAYAPAGAPDTTVTRWTYTDGVAAGSFAFEGALAPGMYVARAFVNDTYTKIGESAAFIVQ